MSDVNSWDPTAGNNTSTPPDGAPEGMAPSTVNDTLREMMAAIRREQIDRELARHYEWQVEDGGATSSPTIVGTGAALTTYGNATSGAFGLIARTTDATTDTDAGWYLNDGDLYTSQNGVAERLSFSGHITTPTDITDVRLYFGLVTASPLAVTDLGAGAIDGAVIRYATDADGTAFWRTITADSGTQTATATTSAIAASGYYKLRVEAEVGTVRFYINNILVATHTTNTPSLSGGGLFPFWAVRTIDAGPVGITRSVSFIKMHLRID